MRAIVDVVKALVILAVVAFVGYGAFQWEVSNHATMIELSSVLRSEPGDPSLGLLYLAAYAGPLLLFVVIVTMILSLRGSSPESKRERASELVREAEIAERMREERLRVARATVTVLRRP